MFIGLVRSAFSAWAGAPTSAVATDWIREGVVDTLLDGVRAETRERAALARRMLPQAHVEPECTHIWVDLPEHCDNAALANVLRPQKLFAVTANVLSVGRPPRNGVRLSLGASPKRTTLEKALRNVGDVLQLVSPLGG